MPSPRDIINLSPGAVWLKADLHVHTPASADIGDRWKDASPEDVVRIAIEKGLDAIAVTDHNTAAWCGLVIEAASNTALTVFPGVEISTSQGHVLAIFDVNTTANVIEDMLIKLGILRTQFGSLEASTQKGIVETCEEIDRFEGVAVAAHVDGEKGFLNAIKVGSERQRAYAAPQLWALEILSVEKRDGYQSGSVSGYPRRMTCLQSSDCWPKGAVRHELDGMAHRYSMVKMDDRSLSGLKLALIDPEMRIRLAKDDATSVADSVVGLWVTGGFLQGQSIRLNENVNCFIGDTGAGKSVAIELLRFGLCQPPKVPKIQAEVTNLLREQLGAMGTVHILIKKGDTHYLVERTWATPLGPPIVRRLFEDQLEPVSGELDMRLFFPVKAFSQSEIIEFAREPEVRLSLTDDLIDCTSELAAIKDLKVSLRENASNIMAERGKEANIQQALGELSTLVEARAQIDKVLNDPKITQHQQWYKEQTLIDSAQSQLKSVPAKIPAAIASVNINGPEASELVGLPNTDLMEELAGICEDWRENVAAAKQALDTKSSEVIEKLAGLRGRWQTRFAAAETEYQQLLTLIDKDGVGLQAQSERRKKLESHIATLEQRKGELETLVYPKIKELGNARDEFLTKLQDNRRRITAKREAKAQELSDKLDQRIHLNVHARSSIKEFRAALEDLVQGSRLQKSDLDLLAKCHPVPFAKFMLAQDFELLSEQTEVDQSKLSRVWTTILDRDRLQTLYDLQLTDVEDVIEVMLRVEQGSYKTLEALSHGQKCMVVLMVSLAEGNFPLLVDQPEDALHAPSIEEGIVSTLRSRRGMRQCIFATRNANILVSADAEQILALKADAKHGEVVGRGSLDRFDHRSLVIYHVEGGEAAFKRRQTIYSLRPPT